MPPTAEKNSEKRKVAVHWFRHGLRIHDNPALNDALFECHEFYPVFIFDGEVAGTKTQGYNRGRFLHESLADLDKTLKSHGGRLYVFNGNPVEVFTRLFEEWGVTHLTFEQDPEPPWQARDAAVKKLCLEKGVACVERVSHTLYDPHKIISSNNGSPPHTFALLCQVLDILGPPEKVEATPSLHNVNMPVPENFEENFVLPSMKELEISPEDPAQNERPNVWLGGETRALEILKGRLLVEENAFRAGHVMPNQFKPDLVGPPLSLSPHLRFGCLSVRKFYWGIRDAYSKVHNGEPNANFTAQLIWREYFYCMSVGNPKYNKMDDNPICLRINWYRDQEQLDKWTMGKTGFPWIDACMNQLRVEGWIHHTSRHAVSCFLTRGDLWIHWEDGLKVFDHYLLDADWSLCAGNWMWVSSSAFESALQCPKCFSPVFYGMRMDPTGEYVRRYVPALKKMPLRYLFSPWKAPRAVQEKAGCIIGEDYPNPMVDHKSASQHCQTLMSEVKAIYKDPSILHCAPSNSDEVREFCWLPHKMADGSVCSADDLCDGIEGM